jgi:tetratricopeptide (TPR) repeat protein
VETGDENEPFGFHLTVEAEVGGVAVRDDLLTTRSTAERAGLVNKTLGLLLAQSAYTLHMQPSSGKLVGKSPRIDEPKQLRLFDSALDLEFQPESYFRNQSRIITYTDKTGSTARQGSAIFYDLGRDEPSSIPPKNPRTVEPPRSSIEQRKIQDALNAEPLAKKVTEALEGGNLREADKLLKELVRTHPNSPQALTFQISRANSLGDIQAARQLYEKLKTYPLSESDKQKVEQFGETIFRKK